MKAIGDALNVNYRFHRYQNYRSCFSKANRQFRPSNYPRVWEFEWWKRIPGNPLNRWSKNNFVEDPRLPRSELNEITMPDSISSKDEAIEYVLFESKFFRVECGEPLTSYEAIKIMFDLRGGNFKGTQYIKNILQL